MRISVIQYYRPNGATREQFVDGMPDDLGPILKQISKCGLQLAAEVLTTGDCSFTLEYPKQACDFDIELCKNGPGPEGTKSGLERLLRRFNRDQFRSWKKDVESEDDGLGVGWGT